MSLDREQGGDSGFPPAAARDFDLARSSGLPLAVDRSGRVDFLEGLPRVEPQPRTLDQMRSVLYNQTATGPTVLYYMYRGLGWPEDRERISGYDLRYDLTVLVPGLVGGEYVKTAGHYHPPVGQSDAGAARSGAERARSGAERARSGAERAPSGAERAPSGAERAPSGAEVSGSGAGVTRCGDGDGGAEGLLTYPELYQVLSGRAHYLLQKPAAGGPAGAIEDAVIVEAGPGDALYVPPGYGHVTINPGPDPLVMVNVVYAGFTSVYGPYRERHGAVYYEIEENGQGYFVPNDHYPDPPEPRLGRPTDLGVLGLRAGEPLYAQLVARPRAFAFLSRPPGDGPIP
ncbi:MAG: glucose-6-phosphate isomerase family protein [Bacillota bacterium]